MEELKAYIQETLPELKELIVELCGIPAPSHHEEKRAEFCRDWLLRNGAVPEQVRIDEALNVVCEVPGETDEVVVFMAHTDTVFPDLEPMPYREENGRMFCPGIGDDTANLAVLLMLAKYVHPGPALQVYGGLCRQLLRGGPGQSQGQLPAEEGLRQPHRGGCVL